MYKKIAHPFYGSAKWKRCRKTYMAKNHYVCEKCGRPADVVHHIHPLKGLDYYDNPEKCFGEDNLMCLCHQCHNEIHHGSQAIVEGYSVNMITGEIEVSPPYPAVRRNSESR